MSDFSDHVTQMTERLAGLRAMQDQIVETVCEVQDVVAFGAHPGLIGLDDELDILYRGQL
ncbi:MAG TPA: hypothetical protein VK545_26540 [Streptomyces sp.]|nr:hypothetical protein [Streptomyces sp.]